VEAVRQGGGVTEELSRPLFAERIRENVARLASGLPLVGVVDTTAGY
jgi:hypothetical protein